MYLRACTCVSCCCVHVSHMIYLHDVHATRECVCVCVYVYVCVCVCVCDTVWGGWVWGWGGGVCVRWGGVGGVGMSGRESPRHVRARVRVLSG